MRKKGGQRLMEMARRSRSKAATKQEAKPAVAGSDRLRLGPVGDKPMFENFNFYSIASDPKEEGGLLQKMLQVFKGDRDYSQPVNPDQEKQEKELGEAVSLLKSIETGLGKITPTTTKLPSEDKEAMLAEIDAHAERLVAPYRERAPEVAIRSERTVETVPSLGFRVSKIHFSMFLRAASLALKVKCEH